MVLVLSFGGRRVGLGDSVYPSADGTAEQILREDDGDREAFAGMEGVLSSEFWIRPLISTNIHYPHGKALLAEIVVALCVL
jgi:hypothetical protein